MDIKISQHKNTLSFDRISRVLSFIHSNLNAQLTLEDIAKKSCWSRWQLQRVFQAETGMTVANYVRELRLSQAAEALLDTSERIIDIALNLGFNSEISFSRSFKNMFGASPSQYRKAGQRVGLKKPIGMTKSFEPIASSALRFVEVRIDTKEAFVVKGLKTEISGLFSLSPDFAQKVPQLWSLLESELRSEDKASLSAVGVIDMTQANFDGTNIRYLAGVEQQTLIPLALGMALDGSISKQLEIMTVPAQTYAVVKHKGIISDLPHTLSWFLLNWLPNSGYRGVDGYELEIYPKDFDIVGTNSEMEYWVPIIKV
ncbi:helix-turn-helix domain-containing protein [Vibrio gallaecicus]|uniref:AraC family transcriptional regulator n=1 Tax=Vibrio TaxID=662 RepID=UPI0010C9AB19|nr:AraC family transcriptional regulator [Vibrio gallaecicus]MDN3613922.1 AraC family transcriptional regulator [Vibrio gallaecicus]